jgi:aspartate racemase
MKTVGVIGGLGPETTSEFYLEVVFGCYKKNKESRPPILIWNVPLKYQIEQDLLTKSSGEERYLPYLIEAAKRLEAGGADFLVMPCNSLHIFIEEIRSSVKIPVLSIVAETAAFLKNKKIEKVGLLATQSSIKNKLYEAALTKEGIEQVLPDQSDQAMIGDIIENIVLNRHTEKDKELLIRIVEKFEGKDVKNVVLACTDLQLLITNHDRLKIYDSMAILAESTITNLLE